MADFTPTQGRYLAFIHAYIRLYGFPPAEADIRMALEVSPPSVNNMMKTLEKKGLIRRIPGVARSIQVLVSDAEIPEWDKSQRIPKPKRQRSLLQKVPSENVYVLMVFIQSGPLSKKYAGKEISRVIEIRGNQTLEELHHAIFNAYDRWEHHLYEFQCGDAPFDEKGPNYGIPVESINGPDYGDAQLTTLDRLELKPGQQFGYWFDFGDDWYHQINVEEIKPAVPGVVYPRVTSQVGKSPPQYRKR